MQRKLLAIGVACAAIALPASPAAADDGGLVGAVTGIAQSAVAPPPPPEQPPSPPSGEAEGQSAANTVAQDANASSETTQVAPINVNAPIRVASDGDNGDVDQSNEASSEATAVNAAAAEQSADQSGNAGGGDQSAANAVAQTANAASKTEQVAPVNVNAPIRVVSDGDNGDVDQSNEASSEATAANAAVVDQTVEQTAPERDTGKDKGCGCQQDSHNGGDQTATNTVTQTANATSTTTQVAPVNVNAPIRVASDGDNGDVEQSNDASSSATATNSAIVEQTTDQTNGGGHNKGQGGDQTANNGVEQNANASSTTTQVAPINLNIPITLGGHGSKPDKGPKPDCGCNPKPHKPDHDKPDHSDTGYVSQSNDASSSATAGNVAIVDQAIDQTNKGGNGDQTATNTVTQNANASSTTTQVAPANLNIPITLGSDTPRKGDDKPNCGCNDKPNTPHKPEHTDTGDVSQSNDASSSATAGNAAIVDQTIDQTNKGDKPRGGHDPKPCGCNDKGKGDKGDAGDQRAANTVTQNANATATTEQKAPINANLPITKGDKGNGHDPKPPCRCQPGNPHQPGHDTGDVNQTNTAASSATATNTAWINQAINQKAANGNKPHHGPKPCGCQNHPPAKHDKGNGGGDQTATNTVAQNANASSTTTQHTPLNLNLANTNGDVTQANSATSTAGATNLTHAWQTIRQR